MGMRIWGSIISTMPLRICPQRYAQQQQVGAYLSFALLDDGGAALVVDPVALYFDEQPEDPAVTVLHGLERGVNVRPDVEVTRYPAHE
jgi:hypothetical protein